MPERKYIRLTRDRAPLQFSVAFVSRSSLWLGEDHLLLVNCVGYTETYKRFFFRDIQAITLRKTRARTVLNWIFGSLAALCGFAIIASISSQGMGIGTFIFVCIVSVIFGIPLLINNLSGSTCACQIRTAVQTEDLPSLARLRKARQTIERIRPLIAEAQGQFTPEEMSARMRELILARPQPAEVGTAPPMISPG